MLIQLQATRKRFQVAEIKTSSRNAREQTGCEPPPRGPTLLWAGRQGTHLVTLKILSSRSARSTLIPKEVPGLMAAQTTSKMLPTMTCKGGGVSLRVHTCPAPDTRVRAVSPLPLQPRPASLLCSSSPRLARSSAHRPSVHPPHHPTQTHQDTRHSTFLTRGAGLPTAQPDHRHSGSLRDQQGYFLQLRAWRLESCLLVTGGRPYVPPSTYCDQPALLFPHCPCWCTGTVAKGTALLPAVFRGLHRGPSWPASGVSEPKRTSARPGAQQPLTSSPHTGHPVGPD